MIYWMPFLASKPVNLHNESNTHTVHHNASHVNARYELCLQALDLRRLHPISIKNILFVETRVINTMIVLTMNLTETMLKPFFVRSFEWTELKADKGESTGIMNIDRTLSFNGLVNKPAENHR